MEDVFGISAEWLILVAVNFFLIFILFIFCLSNRAKLRRLKAKYYRFINGFSSENIEALLEECIDKVNLVHAKNKEIENHINAIDRNLLCCLQKVGVVRYNAFDNVGSDLSFSIALLDNTDTGVVISGLYSRDSSSTYAKPIFGGKSKYALSAEELKALDIAKKTGRASLYTE